MKEETKNCQNCKKNFVIESEDFNFYEKMQVPPPTFCPECRLIRRFIWRNERNLYKDVCELCKKNIISVYAPESPYVVYCPDCWKGDGWDPISYGQDYDFSKPFFEQFNELLKKVPRSAFHQTNVINSPYANYSEDIKNVYLSYSIIHECENVFYSRLVDHSKQILDCCDLSYSEICYENVSCKKNYNTNFAYFSRNVIDSTFVYDCINVSNCFLCTNLRNKQYCYKNKPHSKEEYLKIIKDYNLGSRDGLDKAKSEFKELYSHAIHRFTHLINTTDSTGENLYNCRNVKYSFNVDDGENSKYIFRSPSVKDSMDSSHLGGSEQVYEYMNGGATGSQFLKFCINLKPANNNVEYSDYCGSVSNVFASTGVRNKKYIIFNRQYEKKEYEALVLKIKSHMDEMPYVDKRGRIYKYGEFFPSELSPFAYNETLAHEYFPKNKDEIESMGFRFREREKRSEIKAISAQAIGSNINEVSPEITDELIACDNNGKEETLCTFAFKVLPDEFASYKKANLPIPTKCPNCRYFERTKFVNPLKLWHRSCMCSQKSHNHKEGRCSNEFETSYAPDRPEIIYCERCYQQEVY